MADEVLTIEEVATLPKRAEKTVHAMAQVGERSAKPAGHGTTLVANARPRPGSRSRLLLLDVCEHLEVFSTDTFTMSRSLAVELDLRAKETP